MDNLYMVDRIEGDIVIVESPNGEMINVDKKYIRGNVREGDCLVYKENYYITDIEATEKRKQRVVRIMKGMWKD